MLLDVSKQFPNAEPGEFGGTPDNLTLELRRHNADNAVSLVCFTFCFNLLDVFLDILIGQMADPNVYQMRKPHPEQDKTVLVFYGAYVLRFT
jgi:hypothetical protein